MKLLDGVPMCGAIPLRGDGSAICDLLPLHAGLHEARGSSFRRTVPGTSERSQRRKQQARNRRFVKNT